MAAFSDEELKMFDGYINGSLVASEKNMFEWELSVRKDLATRFALYHAIVGQVKEEALVEQRLKERFQRLDVKQKRKHWYAYIAIAASVVGIMLFLFIIRSSNSTPKDSSASYKVEEPGLPIVMGEGNENTWIRIMQLYKQKEYPKALNAINQMPITDTALYFTGLMEELMGEREKAIHFYQDLQSANRASVFTDKGIYRLAILLWEKHQNKTAKSLLEAIAANDSHIYQGQAKKALTEITKTK